MENVEQRVKKIVAEQLGVNEAEIKNESSFVDDLGADSLDTVELVMALEEEFETEIPDEEAEKITTVQQAIDYIKPTSRSDFRAGRGRGAPSRASGRRASGVRSGPPRPRIPIPPDPHDPSMTRRRVVVTGLGHRFARRHRRGGRMVRDPRRAVRHRPDHPLRRCAVPVAHRRRGQGLRRHASGCPPRKRGATTRSSTTAWSRRWRRSPTPGSTDGPATASGPACASAPASAGCR